jgi:hypothetical protein
MQARTRKKNQEAGKKEANQEETKAPKTSACPSIRPSIKREIFSFPFLRQKHPSLE